MNSSASGDHTPPIGATKGPGESAGDFTIVTPDREGVVKIGEFIYYWDHVNGDRRRIFGRVASRNSSKALPRRIHGRPGHPAPTRSPAFLGSSRPIPSFTRFNVSIMGHFSETMGFVNPRIAPRPGLPVYLAEPQTLAPLLSSKNPGETGAVHVGSLLTRGDGEVPVSMDADEFANTHLAIIAGTGRGQELPRAA